MTAHSNDTIVALGMATPSNPLLLSTTEPAVPVEVVNTEPFSIERYLLENGGSLVFWVFLAVFIYKALGLERVVTAWVEQTQQQTKLLGNLSDTLPRIERLIEKQVESLDTMHTKLDSMKMIQELAYRGYKTVYDRETPDIK